jgi:hypothetical protein
VVVDKTKRWGLIEELSDDEEESDEEEEEEAGAYTLHCSAQLEPFLTQVNTLHTLNTP